MGLTYKRMQMNFIGLDDVIQLFRVGDNSDLAGQGVEDVSPRQEPGAVYSTGIKYNTTMK